MLEHCREKLIKVDAQYFKWFLFFAVTTQREAIIFFYCRGFNSPHNNATTFFGEIQLHVLFFVFVLVGLLNDTENLAFYVKLVLQ